MLRRCEIQGRHLRRILGVVPQGHRGRVGKKLAIMGTIPGAVAPSGHSRPGCDGSALADKPTMEGATVDAGIEARTEG
jgi:hypothetical protein